MTMADATLDDLRRRLQRLEDLEAIKALKARYLNACDLQQTERAKLCFADGDVVIDFGHLGVFGHRDEWAQLYQTFGCHPFVLDMHVGGNPEIEFVDDTHATGLWALSYQNINTRDKTVTLLSVKYYDEYTKLGGEWRISKCRSEFKTALQCSYATGTLEALLAARSVAEPGLKAQG